MVGFTPLTDLGRQQAAELAQSLASVPMVRIYSSPLLRAIQMAEIISVALNMPFDIVDALREPDCGIMEGRSDDAARAEYGKTSHPLLLISHGALIYTMLSITLANAEAVSAEWRPIPTTGLIVVELQAAGWVGEICHSPGRRRMPFAISSARVP